jgi:hypothetical protein
MSRNVNRYGCHNHSYCEQVLEQVPALVPECELEQCPGTLQSDMDEELGPVEGMMPSTAQHATWSNELGRVVLVCGQCMEDQVQVVPGAGAGVMIQYYYTRSSYCNLWYLTGSHKNCIQVDHIVTGQRTSSYTWSECWCWFER